MYLIRTPRPHKSEARILLERLIAAGQRLVTDAVMQEIVHRYAAIAKRDAIGPAFQLLLDVVVRSRRIARSCQPAIVSISRSWSGTGSGQS